MYIAIPVAVSAFAAYGPASLLLCNLFLLPIFMRRKEDFLTPILAVTAALLSYFYISTNVPVIVEEGTATHTLTWSNNVKIDGGKMKGFAKTADGDTIYASYSFENEQEKSRFLAMNIPSVTFTLSGIYREPDIPSHDYSFDMKKYMTMYGASAIFESDKMIHSEGKTGIGSRLSEQRWQVKQQIERAFPASLQTEAKALLIGDRSGMDDELSTSYRKLGITHLFAISGLHVGLLTFLLRGLLLRLTMRKETVDMLLIVLLPLYAVMAGGAPSVWRAVSVTLLVLLTAAGRLRIRLDDAIAISGVVFILYQPFVVFQPGFQLSYLAACSLVYSSRMLEKPQTALGTSFLVTAISQLALYPVLLVHFYELSLSSFFVNLVYVPLYSIIILPANIILLGASFMLPKVADLLFIVYTPLREGVGDVTSWLSTLPYQLWTPGKPEALWATLAVLGTLCFFVRLEQGAKWFASLPLVLVPAMLIHLMPYTDDALRVTFIDVGQGDSIVIELPYRKGIYVIDTGGTVIFGEPTWKTPDKRFEVGRKIVVPYLKGRGITTIDKLVISHADADHMEGADEVLEEIGVKEIHISLGSEKEKTMEAINRLAMEQRIPILSMKEGVSWKRGEASFHYVAPVDDRYVGNDSSLVLYMTTKGPSFLFTGDLELAGERRFLQQYGQVNFGPLILKAGHHGSKTSSSEPFVEALQPDLTIFSAGRNNRYGHPHPDVVATFDKHGLPTMSTAEYGSITVTVKKDRYRISTMVE